MNCDICSRHEEPDLTYHCAGCARSAIYLPRLEHLGVLLETRSLETEINTAIQKDEPNFEYNQALESEEGRKTLLKEARDRVSILKQHQSSTRQEVADLRSSISTLKSQIAHRRSLLRSTDSTIPLRRQTRTAETRTLLTHGRTSTASLIHESTSTRAALCREVAYLMRLRQHRRRHLKDPNAIQETYSLAGLSLPSLHLITTSRCSDLTAVLTSVAHLLSIISFYLGVRLPSEITSPRPDYPLPTINPPQTSYRGKKLEFPGSGTVPTNSNNPSLLANDLRVSQKPRPLFVGSDDPSERLSQVAKREPLSFNFFIEAVALLAWDIAWLCRSQGLTSGTNTLEEICNIGRNLYTLLIVPSHAPPPSSNRKSSTTSPPENLALGSRSHLSALQPLSTPQFHDSLRKWHFSTPTILADALRKTLLNEMNNAEWELLNEREWDSGGEGFDEAVVVKGRGEPGHTGGKIGLAGTVAGSVMTVATERGEGGLGLGIENGSARQPGTSGWTKLKSRER